MDPVRARLIEEAEETIEEVVAVEPAAAVAHLQEPGVDAVGRASTVIARVVR
jgi:hypothetical protein